MFLEVTFEDGQTGRYPCTTGATVTIQEPAREPLPGVSAPGASFAFALSNVASVVLQPGDLSPGAAPVVAEPVAEPPAEPVASAAPSAPAVAAADFPWEPSTPAASVSTGSASDTAPVDAAAPSVTPTV